MNVLGKPEQNNIWNMCMYVCVWERESKENAYIVKQTTCIYYLAFSTWISWENLSM